MAARPYTETFVRGQGQGVFTFSVPDGKRAVVSSIAAANFALPPVQVNCQVAGTPVFVHGFQAQNSAQIVALRAVAYAGQVIYAYASGPGAYITVSGYLFDDPAGFLYEDYQRALELDSEGTPLPT